MNKAKILIPSFLLTYLLIGSLFLIPKKNADEPPIPTIPTLVGWSSEEGWTDESYYLYGMLYNPPLNEAINRNVGKKICSIETSLTFPKDLLEVQTVNFEQNDANNFSNSTGIINYKVALEPCTTIVYIDLFEIEFKAKQLGEGTMRFTKSVVTGEEDGQTVIQSGIYQDMQVRIVPIPEDPEPYVGEPDNPFGDIPQDIPQPEVKPVARITPSPPKPKTTPAPSQDGATAPQEDTSIKAPTVSNLIFGPNASLDKTNGKSNGAIFSGTSEPNANIKLLINSNTTILDSVNADTSGNWTYTLTGWLEDGLHKITAWSEKNDKKSPQYSSPFVISSYDKDQIALGDTYPDIKPEQAQAAVKKVDKGNKTSILKNRYFLIYIAIGIILAVFLIIFFKKRKKQEIQINSNENISTFSNPDLLPEMKPIVTQPQVNSAENQTISAEVTPNTISMTPSSDSNQSIEPTDQNSNIPS